MIERSNPLLLPFETLYDTAPFSSIKSNHFKPAIEECIKIAQREIDTITNNTENPTFENTIEALDFSGSLLEVVTSIFFNLNTAETTEEIQVLAKEIAPLLSNYSNDVLLNTTLFSRIKKIYHHKKDLNLNDEQNMLLERTYKKFTRNGANLDDESKTNLREIDQKLAVLKLNFGENVLAETNNFELHITNVEDLEGLPTINKKAAQELAKSKGKEGFVFTLDFPSYIPFITYVKKRELRQIMAIAYGSKAFKGNEYNNQENIKKIVELRHKRAKLLGYDSHAHYVLEERMAKTPTDVNIFLNDLLKKALPAALKELEQLQQFAKKDGIETLEKWDVAFYSEKLKMTRFNFDDEILKPYFKLENVVNGVFKICDILFDLKFEESFEIDKYHPEIRTYKVTDKQDNFIAILYTDFHPRKGKRNGAWMTSFKNQFIKNGKNSRPHISIVCNFSRATEDSPSLLTFNEVKTLFHEFGHALHGMLANTTYRSLSGTNVFWDFVELPSQLFENWCYEKESLKLFAFHYLTNEPISDELIQKIKESRIYLEGLATVRQLSFGKLDMAYHANAAVKIDDVKDFELAAFENTQLFSDIKENCVSTSFSHIFQGGYSSGYYSYKWAEVLDADAFEYFKLNGIFNKEISTKYKNTILSKGGTIPPMDLFFQFTGKKPSINPLLKRANLIN
ncbi:MAG: M3 family metallopeptidase [Bacteroidetes bacterium]|nr:M3 family metallopeptidase [Bacteroidota bacterium]